MSCGCACCRKPRYKRLIDSLFPEDPQDPTPVASNMDKLLYFARSSPEHLDRMGEYLTSKVRRSLQRERRGHTFVALKISERLISECDERRIQLIADSYLEILHAMLESTHTDVQIMATNSFVMFSEREEGNAPYHRQYDFFIHRFASLSLNKGGQNYKETRMTGLKGLRGVIKKIGSQDGPQLNIWAIDHMNKIVPPFLFNMQGGAAGTQRSSGEIQNESDIDLASYAEAGLKDLVQCAGLANIDSVIKPVLQHFDLNELWTNKKEFAAGAFVLIVETMQKQDRYKAIQSLVDHLDAKAKESCDLKQGILDTLSQCVAVAADGSLGPSVLDVFRTLVKHLRISIEGGQSTSEQLVTSQDSQRFQESITKTVGEFAGVLPDYHKPDIMNLINSYMPPEGGVAGTVAMETVASSEIEYSHTLTTSLVKCLKAVADTYHPAILEATFPDALFKSLVQLFTISEQSIQLDVLILWHQLVDHHDNKDKIPLHTDWESLKTVGLTLGKVSDRFINKTSSLLYTSLYEHAKIVSINSDNLVAFYQLLSLLTLELSHPGLNDMMSYLSKLQDLAVEGNSLSLHHRTALHAIVAGILHLVAQVSTNAALQDHINEVIGLRREMAPHLLPASVFGDQLEAAEGSESIEQQLLFQLKEENLLRKSPEPRSSRGFGPFHTDASSSGPDLATHFSVSLDYGPDSPLSVDQISFNNLKEKVELVLSSESNTDVLLSGEDDEPQGIPIVTAEGTGHRNTDVSFEEALKGASKENSDINGLDISEILNKATSPSQSVPIPACDHNTSGSAYDMELPSLH